jgi:hypothetical protein
MDDLDPVEYAHQYFQDAAWREQACKQRMRNERTQILKSVAYLLLLGWLVAVNGFNWLFGLGIGIWAALLLAQLYFVFTEIRLLLLIYKNNNMVRYLLDQHISRREA